MESEQLRWILLALSLVLLVGIWWWGARRSRHSPRNPEWRDSSVGTPAWEEAGVAAPPLPRTTEDSREWGVPPFEPLSIHTADFDQVQLMDLPMTATSDPLDVTLNLDYVEHEVAAERAVSAEHAPGEPELAPAAVMLDEPPAAAPPPPPSPAPPPPAPPSPPSPPPPSLPPKAAAGPAETQRIVTVRVSAAGDSRWPGTALMAALDAQGMEFGRYKVFHLKHSDGRTLFCAASLVEPGTFDLAKMPHDEFRGLTLFAVLPGPADALQTIDVLIATAAELADHLEGTVQDSNGAPMSPQRAEALREDVARFQASLT